MSTIFIFISMSKNNIIPKFIPIHFLYRNIQFIVNVCPPIWIGKSMKKVLIDMGLLRNMLEVNVDLDDYLFKLYMWIYLIRCF